MLSLIQSSRHTPGIICLFFFIFLLVQPIYALEPVPGVTERTGEAVPLDAMFTDETGKSAPLKSLLGKPAILSFAYFSCKDQCNTVLSNLASALGRTSSAPGEDFLVLTVSFDDEDTREEAAYKKKNYMSAAGRPMDEGAWKFLTGGKTSIEALTGAIGFGFRKTEKGYDHPAALAVLSADGRIIRYVYGSSYLPADLEMALMEAREGRITASIKKAARFCFSSAPGGRAYLVSVLRVAGLSTLVVVAGLFIYLKGFGGPGKKVRR